VWDQGKVHGQQRPASSSFSSCARPWFRSRSKAMMMMMAANCARAVCSSLCRCCLCVARCPPCVYGCSGKDTDGARGYRRCTCYFSLIGRGRNLVTPTTRPHRRRHTHTHRHTWCLRAHRRPAGGVDWRACRRLVAACPPRCRRRARHCCPRPPHPHRRPWTGAAALAVKSPPASAAHTPGLLQALQGSCVCGPAGVSVASCPTQKLSWSMRTRPAACRQSHWGPCRAAGAGRRCSKAGTRGCTVSGVRGEAAVVGRGAPCLPAPTAPSDTTPRAAAQSPQRHGNVSMYTCMYVCARSLFVRDNLCAIPVLAPVRRG
jgi:hypothetical protein